MSQDDSVPAGDPLPTWSDFVPWEDGDLDAEWAWGNFGGLTLSEAHSKFGERPHSYQEDFMFMGGKAFAFYFPVIEHYLRSGPSEAEYDREAWILAKCIENQLTAGTSPHIIHLSDRFIALSVFIQENITRFGDDKDDLKRIVEAWQDLDALVRSVTNPNGAESEQGTREISA